MIFFRGLNFYRCRGFGSFKNTSLFRCYCRNHCKRYFATKSESELREEFETVSYYDELKNNFTEKVIYHSYYKYESFILKKQKEAVRKKIKENKLKRVTPIPVSLKYILGDSYDPTVQNSNEKLEDDNEDSVVLPYEVSKLNIPISDQEKSADSTHDNDEGFVYDPSESSSFNELLADSK